MKHTIEISNTQIIKMLAEALDVNISIVAEKDEPAKDTDKTDTGQKKQNRSGKSKLTESQIWHLESDILKCLPVKTIVDNNGVSDVTVYAHRRALEDKFDFTRSDNLKKHGWTDEQLADEFNCTEAWIKHMYEKRGGEE